MADQIGGFLSSYLQRKRIQSILPSLSGKILDYGCGTGNLSKYIDGNCPAISGNSLAVKLIYS